MISAREVVFKTPWISIIKKHVLGALGKQDEYYSVQCADYVTIIARTPSGRFPLIHQFRQAIEIVTCEFPAGLVDPGESPEATCIRELKEETGLTAKNVTHVATRNPDTGRLANLIHIYFVETDEPPKEFKEEAGLKVEYVTLPELTERIKNGDFQHLLHVGSFFLAQKHLHL